jgi:hypothetical protein
LRPFGEALPLLEQLCVEERNISHIGVEEEEEEEEDLFVFNDTIEGPRAPAVKPGNIVFNTHTCFSVASQ